jgi:hypothetical protein
MPAGSPSYVQRLPALGLAILQNTGDVPHDGWFYLVRADVVLGRYRYLKAAKAAWDQVLAESGWTPPPKSRLSPEEVLKREKVARDRADYFEYWNSGRRHSW